MSYNGSGTFNINTAGQPVVTGTTISSTAFNALTADIGTGLSTAITKDGQTTPTANIPMGAFRITGLGVATARTDAAQYAQVQNSAPILLGTVAGTNTITAVLTPTLTAYTSGQTFTLNPANANTGAATLNIDGLGAKNIFSGGVACIGGELRAAVPVSVEYDGTQFNILGQSGYGAGWTPTDASGAGLVLVLGSCTVTRAFGMVFAEFDITYPATADASNSLIGGLPFTSANTTNNCYANGISNNSGTAAVAMVVKNATTFGFSSASAGTNILNSTLSGKVLRGIVIYRAAS